MFPLNRIFGKGFQFRDSVGVSCKKYMAFLNTVIKIKYIMELTCHYFIRLLVSSSQAPSVPEMNNIDKMLLLSIILIPLVVD